MSASRWEAYLELTKPRLSALVLATTAAGFWLGHRDSEPMISPASGGVMVGTALVVAGANALNQWRERALDALMDRTKGRPLPSGRLAPEAACRFGAVLSVAGLLTLAVGVNALSTVLAMASWASYVLVYTPMKRFTPLCTLVGAIPGALPPVIGWAAARSSIGPGAVALFTILFVWQLPHFLALAALYRDDYARAGFRMLPLMEPEGLAAARQTALYGAALLPISLFPAALGLAGGWYGFGATALGLAFLALSVRAAWFRSRCSARQLFHASLLYLPVLLGLLVFNRT